MSIQTYFKKARLKNRAATLRKRCEQLSNAEEVVDCVLAAKKFSLVQKRSEIIDFIKLVKDLKPRIICDIGSSGGGTLRLFSHFASFDARILSIDIQNTPVRQAAFTHLVKPEQKITILNASSYDDQTIEFVKDWLSGERFDLLFIDGDHEYEGVSQDFKKYSSLVRDGGLIGLHDIVEDYKTRYDRQTPAYVGEVPRFWQEIQDQHLKIQEFIENPDQDGYGIGVITWQNPTLR